MRPLLWLPRRPAYRPPAELHGVVALVLAACLFLCLCTTQVPAAQSMGKAVFKADSPCVER